MNEEEKEEEVDRELEETIKRVERERKKADKKERERKMKSDMRLKMSVIANTDIHNGNDELLFDRRTLERLQQMDIENMEYENSEDEEEEPQKADIKLPSKRNIKAIVESEESDSDMDEGLKRINRMADDVNAFYKQKKEYAMEKDKKLAKKEKKRKALMEQQRAKREDESENEALDNDDVREKKVKFSNIPELDEDTSENDDDLLEESDNEGALFINPLSLNK